MGRCFGNGTPGLRVVGAGVDAVEADTVAGEESAEPVVHGVQGGGVEQPACQAALVGDDDQGEARVLEGAQWLADVLLEDQLVGVTGVVAGLGEGAVAVEENRPEPIGVGGRCGRRRFMVHGHERLRTGRRHGFRQTRSRRSAGWARPC